MVKDSLLGDKVSGGVTALAALGMALVLLVGGMALFVGIVDALILNGAAIVWLFGFMIMFSLMFQVALWFGGRNWFDEE